METTVISTEELLRTNPALKALWENDRQIRLSQPLRTSEEFIAQALEMKRVAGLRASNGHVTSAALAENMS
ncbi:MAG: hypothetical protein ACKVY0_15945 [Prosthecobacter sp.]|uniref:hypothetical protein n=1 Tax=Prosthecobacter sp. TaxID=1965333 RepID=UPI003901829C